MRPIISSLPQRLERIGVSIKLTGNFPWVYLHSVDGNRIQPSDYFGANHGFCAFILHTRGEHKGDYVLTDRRKLFNVIRKYRK